MTGYDWHHWGMPKSSPSLAERVAAARTKKGWSKEEAARNAGISSITWKRIEDGLRVHDSKLAAALEALDMGPDLPPGVQAIGNPDDDLVEFRVSGAFGVQAVVKGPIRDIDALQAAVSKLIAGMRVDEADEAPG